MDCMSIEIYKQVGMDQNIYAHYAEISLEYHESLYGGLLRNSLKATQMGERPTLVSSRQGPNKPQQSCEGSVIE